MERSQRSLSDSGVSQIVWPARTGKSVRVTGMDIMRYRDGQVIELWSQFDDLGLLQQLGIVPHLEDRQPSP